MTASSRGPHPEPPADPEATAADAADQADGPGDGPAAPGADGDRSDRSRSHAPTGPADDSDHTEKDTAAPGGAAGSGGEPGAPDANGVPADSPSPAAESAGSVGGSGTEEPGTDGSGSGDEDADDPAAANAPGDEPGASGDDAPADSAETAATGTDAKGDPPELSEAQAELAAQRELRARIEQRKADRGGPVASGAGLSGSAADLLAAVRAVERGDRPGSAFYDTPTTRPAEPAAPDGARTAAPRPAPVPAARQGAAPDVVAAVRAVLAAGNGPESAAVPAAEALGERAGAVLRDDPWRLLSVPGIRPEQADGFARALLGGACGPDDPRRAAALIAWELERAALRGHTAVDSAEVLGALADRSVPDPRGALDRAVAEGVVLAFAPDGGSGDGSDESPDPAASEDHDPAGGAGATEDDPGPEGPVLLGLDRYALAEESLADGLARLARGGPEPRWDSVAEPTGLTRALAASGLVAHTGGEAARAEPAALAGLARELGLTAVVAAHSEQTAASADPAGVTVAALLSGTAGPGRDEDGAWALDLLVVLDAPRLDTESAAMLVESLPDGARLVLSGDPGQLGPAGAGDVFADLLAAGVCPRIASRVPDPGPIGELVSGIGAGELNQVAAPGKDVVIVPVRDAGEAVHRTVQLVADSIPRAIGVPADRTQVITVGHGGSAGTRALNAALKTRLNPGPGRFGGYDPGDRVAYTPAPGRTVPGTVVSADAAGLRLDCGGTAVTVAKERVEAELRHGWALTAHQAAALRWPAAVVVLPGDATAALSRPWVYTAFGRADRHLSVVHGAEGALPRAVATIPALPRTTRLRPLLAALLQEPGEASPVG
ncbi:AAA family ATPase [Streptomyces sp. NPDC006798]|uniref:helix-hairpin-helix domain-containing protein n=1 Tax=Streptomyces sp. NPDC006798 TaxID=3155462 RepID=UPI0033E123BD